jgi:hypothetical protein
VQLDLLDPLDPLAHQDNVVQVVRGDQLDLQEKLVYQDLQGLQDLEAQVESLDLLGNLEEQEDLVHQASQDHQDLLVHVGIEVNLDLWEQLGLLAFLVLLGQGEREDQVGPQDLLDCQDHLALQVNRGQEVNLERGAHLGCQAHLDPSVQVVNLEKEDYQVSLERQASLARGVILDLQVEMVVLAQGVHQGLQVPEVSQGLLEERGLLGHRDQEG